MVDHITPFESLRLKIRKSTLNSICTMTLVACLIFFSLVCFRAFSENFTCDSGTNCTSISCSSDQACFVSCSDGLACQSINVECPSNNDCTIECLNSKSCHSTNIILNSQTKLRLECLDKQSCIYSNIYTINGSDSIIASDISIECVGEESCANTNFTLPSNTTTIDCAGVNACNSGKMDARDSVILNFNSSNEYSARYLELLSVIFFVY